MSAATLLVVEDHDILREGLRILLESEGFQVIPAAHGLEALDAMRRVTPELILSDISMPEMDGFTFYNAVRANPDWVTIPFIFLTARGDRDDVFASKKLGAEDYLIKPVDRQELVTTIHSRLERSQQLMMAQLQQAYEASLIMLANAIELRDRYTRGHVERVMHYAMVIASEMGWSQSQIKALQFGAILHDIGKIYVQEDILSKAGPLDTEQWNEMRQHSIMGADLLQKIPYLNQAIPIIRHHHERWDGSGYPRGLKGDEIPLGARIVSVADSFDAMTTARVYQRTITPEDALAEIQKGSGARYDPAVVNAFTTAWDRIINFR